MKAIIKPFVSRGIISAIPSKSYAHRALICAALANGTSELSLERSSEDIEATAEALISLGAGLMRSQTGFKIRPIRLDQADPSEGKKTVPLVNCRESGSTLRFLLPLAAVYFDQVRFRGEGRLPQRPIAPLIDAMKANGSEFSDDKLPLTIKTRMTGTRYSLPGDVSSQFISGLLMAAPGLGRDVEIHLSSVLESEDYVNITQDVMKSFGVSSQETADGYLVKGGQSYQGIKYQVEGDWSNAAFFLAAGALRGTLTMTGLKMDSVQGDRGILTVLEDFGARIEIKPSDEIETDYYNGNESTPEKIKANASGRATVNATVNANASISASANANANARADIKVDSNLNITIYNEEKQINEMIRVTAEARRNFEVDLTRMPDSLPILAVLAASVDGGVSRFTNGRRLRLKESDRLHTVATMITDLGGRVRELDDALEVYGTGGLTGGATSSFNDHRLAMAAAVAAVICKEPVEIEEPQAVQKSYPGFYEDLEKIGGIVNAQQLR